MNLPQGNTRGARLPEGQRVYAVGDVHGSATALAKTFARIDKDYTSLGRHSATEIYLGDLVDRGPDSAEVIAMVMARARSCHVVCLLGNHELYLLHALDDPVSLATWLKRGGKETLKSYGIDPARMDDIPETHRLFCEAFGEKERNFLSSFLPMYKAGDYLFVHAGIRPGTPLALQKLSDLTSIREAFLRSSVPMPFVVVHGHTRTADIDIKGQRINIDTGAYLTGHLPCLVLEDAGIRIL